MKKKLTILLLTLLPIMGMAQDAKVQGTVTDEKGKGIYAQITVNSGMLVFFTDENGFYQMDLEGEHYYKIQYTAVGSESRYIDIYLKKGETKTLDLSLQDTYNSELGEADVYGQKDRNQAGTIYIDAEQIRHVPTAVGGVEALIKQFVGSQNEMTSQYNVRGGNFDENLVYINDFEVYRPYLVRSGQQEGLSVINPDLVKGISFSTGGFQAKYRDKMSSVLDIDYRQPKKTSGSLSLGLLGAGISLQGLSDNNRFYYLTGLRYKSNQYFLQSQPTKGVYTPSFTDFQLLMHYDVTDKLNFEFFGNYANNRFFFIPEKSKTAFGTFSQALAAELFYDGSELDKFRSGFLGTSAEYRASENTNLKFLLSHYRTQESENFDIATQYRIGILGTDPSSENYGEIVRALGDGALHHFGRNFLNIDVTNLRMKAFTNLKKHFLQYGFDFSFNNIKDRYNEWYRTDSAGYNQPFDPREPLFSDYIRANNKLYYNVFSVFVQDNLVLSENKITLNYGLRTTYQGMNKEWLFSPRVQFSYKVPDNKDDKDLVLRLAGGIYHQPNFYRELRNLRGEINPDLKAQKSWQAVGGIDYNFKMWDRPFKFTSELYYKNMWDIIPYEFDNIRIRYFGANSSKAYAMGWESRLYGDIVPGAESWISMGLMKTEEDIIGDSYVDADGNVVYPGYIPRPTDSRFNFGMYFQDYLRNNPNYKVHLSMIYATGLPTGPPDNERYTDTYRIHPYIRMDMGLSALLLDKDRNVKPYYSLFNNLESIWLSLEVFNVLGNLNTLSYSWLSDNNSNRTYFVPNQLTSRLINLRMIVDF